MIDDTPVLASHSEKYAIIVNINSNSIRVIMFNDLNSLFNTISEMKDGSIIHRIYPDRPRFEEVSKIRKILFGQRESQ